MNEKEIKKILQTPTFAGVGFAAARDAFASCGCRTAVFSAGENILSPSGEVGVAGILLDGKAEIHTPDAGKKTFLRRIAKGELFGIANIFSGQPFISVITAKSNCTVFLLTEACVARLMETDRVFLTRYIGFLTGRIRFLNQKIGYLTAGSAERRLALYLSDRESGSVTDADSISSLSELLDVGRASLYRAFEKLEADGWIRKDGKKIIVPDAHALRNAYSGETK